jgi:PPOX class probable F420-dependent enzyme
LSGHSRRDGIAGHNDRMSQKMTDEAWRVFVSHGTRTGKLSTVSADGAPHVAPVWFVLDGDDVVFNTGKSSLKGRNLARDGRAALCVDDETSPYAFVTLRGRCILSEDLTQMRLWSTRIAERYVAAHLAEQFGARNAVVGELLVRLRVAKAVGYTGITD